MSSSHPSTSSSSILPLILSLPPTHPSVLPLIASHQVFAKPSLLPTTSTAKWVIRLSQAILQRENEAERRAACEVAAEAVRQDGEGWVLGSWGKGWVGGCLGFIAAHDISLASIPPLLDLLKTIIIASAAYPSFERETIHPVMGKVSVTFLKLLDRAVNEASRNDAALASVLETLLDILTHSPASFRPSVPSLRPHLISLILQLPASLLVAASSSLATPAPILEVPPEIRRTAADVLAALHLTAGKAQSSAAWAVEMRDALGGLGAALSGIAADGWQEEPPRLAPPISPAGMPTLPSDAAVRLSHALDAAEGWVEVVLALLKFPSSRPVPVPVAHLVSAGLRCMNLTLETPVVAYITPQHHASLATALPRMWTCGMLILGGLTQGCGDHLFPHLTAIFDHSVYLLETLPSSMLASHAQLLRFHRILLTEYPAPLLPVDYHTRLLRRCLDDLSPLLDSRPLPGSIELIAGGGGKRGKKRARGAEDGLVGGLEGREGTTIGGEAAEVLLESLRLIPLLHPCPLLAPSLLTFSIRLHLSIFLALPGIHSSFADPRPYDAIRCAVKDVLAQAIAIPDQGTARGWKSVILSVLDDNRGRFEPLLHPTAPPLPRPPPPLSSLYFFGPESEEEKKLRQEMGFSCAGDEVVDVQEMDIDFGVDGSGTGSFEGGRASLSGSASHHWKSTQMPPPQGVSASHPGITPHTKQLTPHTQQVVHTATVTKPAPIGPIRIDTVPGHVDDPEPGRVPVPHVLRTGHGAENPPIAGGRSGADRSGQATRGSEAQSGTQADRNAASMISRSFVAGEQGGNAAAAAAATATATTHEWTHVPSGPSTSTVPQRDDSGVVGFGQAGSELQGLGRTAGKGKEKEVVLVGGDDDDDEPFPEMDSGLSEFGMDEDDEDEDDDEDDGGEGRVERG